ncbi:hypothetical protein [Klebsiella phage VLC4]|uniref:Uncharacterized protein n=2 Tax=Drulisvirus TaxID=1920774 RepID=A0A6B9I9U9_9CAUD|nr:hypothetical protein [Klebsiella phage VLC4]UEW68119.1 hypothetical protein [Klebsiella phage vB_KpnM-VAC25]UVX29092.1 hypothetical protein A1r_00046 [Klebsiella phage VLCpiA1r]UVX29159.1 hypothetical protein A1q_00056 [Klebsiella phage VLCpiA1q]
MSKFKVGDKVVRKPRKDNSIFEMYQGSFDYYTITGISKGGWWLQLDNFTDGGADHYPWYANNFELYQEPEDELPPAPKSVRYHHIGYSRLNCDSYLDVYTGSFAYGPHIRLCNKDNIGITVDADTALQLAHDLRRMAMDIKRKEKVQ